MNAAVNVAIRGALLVALIGACTPKDEARCGPAFVAVGDRCCATRACDDAPPAARRVAIPAVRVVIGPSDWEAEGRVAPRVVVTAPFAIDAYEATVADMDAFFTDRPAGEHARTDRARAASRITRDEAARFCAARGGRLPTEDEWIAAAAGDTPRRYPWGDTGAVCRRAAWGLASGPCGTHGTGPDTVGAHPDGATPLGVEDLAGNVAEWVTTVSTATTGDRRVGVARGGSWRTALATELRTWARLELDPASRDDRVGVRCAYDARGSALFFHPTRLPSPVP